MSKTIFFAGLVACILAACGNNPAGDEETAKPAITPPVGKMDMLEKMFNNDNWMKVSGNDTSYYYFSRIPMETRVYQYRINKGDSAGTRISVMRFSNDTLLWQYNDSALLFLSGITEKRSEWSRMEGGTGSLFMILEQEDDKHIHASFADKRDFRLTRTLPLSTFLIRSRYDYLHGTRYAFADTVFSTGKKKN